MPTTFQMRSEREVRQELANLQECHQGLLEKVNQEPDNILWRSMYNNCGCAIMSIKWMYGLEQKAPSWALLAQVPKKG